ncbi:metabotropic glutamate receptor 3-like [Saccostrea echinata]|uniref:metabotropic glutamate receptor 3-like n=1 Tax=Saccostrea echinata TaxID=191078 RepID=UPI002A7EE6D2|nr:metabotropic glutamate receptor 3-like [Saccostrea echinata]
MIFALSEVNVYLREKGITLGLKAYDTCYSINPSLEYSLEFAQQSFYTKQEETGYNNCTALPSRRVIGVIGPATSRETQYVATLLTLFKMPQISGTATSSALNDGQKYKYFKRTVPSDTYQAKGIVQLLRANGWVYVSILYEDSSYGRYGYNDIKKFARLDNICIGYEKQTSEDMTDLEITEVLTDLKSRRNEKGKIAVVLFMLYRNAYRIIQRIHDMRIEGFIWTVSDGLTGLDPPVGLENIMDGAIGLALETLKYPGYIQYVNNQSRETNANPWYSEFLQEYYPNCTTGNCGRINNTGVPYIISIRDAVYAFGNAILSIHSEMCKNDTGVCEKIKEKLTGDLLLEYLEKSKNPFNTSFHFVDGVEGPPRYSILQYKGKGNNFKWTEIGKFVEDKLLLNITETQASCSVECLPGYIKRITEICCWDCTPCPSGTITNSSDPYSCTDCSHGYTPNAERNECIQIPISYFSYENPFSIAILVLSVLGFVLCIVVSVVFVRKRNTPLLKATGFETSMVMLSSILMSYISPFILLSYPSSFSCAISRLFIGMSYTLAYSSVLSKLIVYKRAFDVRSGIKLQAAKGQHLPRPYMCTMMTALLLSLALSVVQLLAIIFWLIIDTPEHKITYDLTSSPPLGHRTCKDSNNFNYFLLLFWPFMLMIACLILAIKTRKLPEGMNDSREIMYCSFTSFIIWLAFVPLYAFSTTIAARVISLCVSLFIHATVFLSCLFLTKIYIVVFRPEKNNKDRVMRSTAASPSKTNNTISANHHSNGLQTKRTEQDSHSYNYTVEEVSRNDELENGYDVILSTNKMRSSNLKNEIFDEVNRIDYVFKINENPLYNTDAQSSVFLK